MNDEYILERGYKQYEPTSLDNESVVARFQKRFDDSFGKKYFIDILKWDNSFIPETHRGDWYKQYSYEYEVQVSVGENENCINLLFYSSWSLEQVEDFMERFFEKMKLNHYESWDE